MQSFFDNKLGVTFDGVKTAPDADELSITKPLTDMQKRFLQNDVDSIYHDFKSRVAAGRNKSIEYIDSIGQGRVWSGVKGLELGLVDRLGGLQDAVDCAARMAKTKDYRLREYPEEKTVLEQFLGNYRRSIEVRSMKQELGEEGFRTFKAISKIKTMMGIPQARLPYEFAIQ